jgi:hypothetical protein
MTGLRRPQDEMDSLARRIAALEARARDSRYTAFRIPVLAHDPDDTDATNIWMLHDGRIRTRKRNTANTAWVIDEWVRTAPGSSTSATLPPSQGSAATSQVLRATAVWSSSYTAAGAARTGGADASLLYYGYNDASNGRNRAYLGLDYATLVSTLAGSTITGVQLLLQNLYSISPQGSDLYFGLHNVSGASAPSTWQGTVISQATKRRMTGADEQYIDLPILFGTSIRDGTAKGLAIEVPDDSPSRYGYAAGVGSGYDLPELIVYYSK